MAAFAGIDLAWKTGKESGVCILEEADGSVFVRELSARPIIPDDLADELTALGPDVVAAIDAPLRLVEGRTADRETARRYARFHAAPYTPSDRFLALSGRAGPDLADALLRRGWTFDPADHRTGRVAVEVFPHTCHVELFELSRRLSYKKGRLAERQQGTLDYGLRLVGFLDRHLPALASALRPLVVELGAPIAGRNLKHVEDQLDAATCAYTAWHLGRYGTAGVTVFGDWRTGAIVVPVLMGQGLATSVPAPTYP